MSPDHPDLAASAQTPAATESEQPSLSDRVEAAFERSYTAAYRMATIRAYAGIRLEAVLAGHDGLLSRCRDHLADPHLQDLYRQYDIFHDPLPQHPALAHTACLVVALNRFLSACRNPAEVAWARRCRNDLESAFLIPLSELAAGEVRLRHDHAEKRDRAQTTGIDSDTKRVQTIDYHRYLRITTPIRCDTRTARALVDFQSGMNVKEAFSCFRIAAKGNDGLQKDLDFYWEQIESLAPGELDDMSLTDLYIKVQGSDNNLMFSPLFRCLLVIPLADLYHTGLLDVPAAVDKSPVSALDYLLAKANS